MFQTLSTIDFLHLDHDMFSVCPRLSSGETECPPGSLESVVFPDMLVLPWSQIRTWKVGVEQAHMLLARACDSLVRLEVSDARDMPPARIPEDKSNLVSNVVFLAIRGPRREHPDHHSHLLHYVSFPQLTSLELYHIKPFWFTSLLNCLVRSACTITSLTLENPRLTDDEVVSLLRHTPMVRTFSTGLKPPPQTFLKSFTLKHERFPSPSPLLPLLQNVTLRFSRFKPDVQDIVAVLASRWLPDPDYARLIGVSCLRCVTITLPYSVERSSIFVVCDRFTVAEQAQVTLALLPLLDLPIHFATSTWRSLRMPPNLN
ncbi:hypothetical protein PM082_012044 [Marasmius tenuissimus]|nr:hypothetical protein PM082_012044 [Marasmius tenuissimus]